MSYTRMPATCRLEALEDRHLLAITAQLLDGGATLKLMGDMTDDTVILSQDDASNTLMVNWLSASAGPSIELPQPMLTYQSSSISKIVVDLKGGDDHLSYVLGSDTLQWAKQLSVDLGSGNDTAMFDFGGSLFTIQDYGDGDVDMGIPATGNLGGDVDVPFLDPNPAELNARLRIDVNGGSGNDTVDAIFGNVNANLVYRVSGDAGQDSLSSSLAGLISTRQVAVFDLIGGEGKDTLTSHLGQEGVAQGANLTVLQRGGNGDDILSVEGYSTLIQGRVAIKQFGGNGNDILQSTVLAQWGSEGRISAAVNGENGNDNLVVRLKRESLPPDINLFRPLDNFVVAAIANGGSGRNQAWLTPNVRSMFNKVVVRAWDDGFPIPVDPWPF